MKILIGFFPLACLVSCQQKKDYDIFFKNPLIYSNTVHELNTIVMGNNFSPIVASRNYMYAAVAGYEIIASSYPEKYNSLAGQIRGLKAVPNTRLR